MRFANWPRRWFTFLTTCRAIARPVSTTLAWPAPIGDESTACTRPGVKCAVHLDGTVQGLLPKLIRSGFDAIEALTPKPGGDLDCDGDSQAGRSKPRNLLGRRARLMFSPPYTWQQMESYLRRLIECWRGPAVHSRRGRSGAARRRHRVLPPNRRVDWLT